MTAATKTIDARLGQTRAWVITIDHLAEEFGDTSSDVGRAGPSTATDEQIEALLAGAGYEFKMYDDDGELYVTGRGFIDADESEEFCYGPLGDYGFGGMGCTEIRWTGHKEWDCG